VTNNVEAVTLGALTYSTPLTLRSSVAHIGNRYGQMTGVKRRGRDRHVAHRCSSPPPSTAALTRAAA
jgi:hypothetical protein